MIDLGPRVAYRRFNPPRRPEEYAGVGNGRGGLLLPADVLEEIATARVQKRICKYLVAGEWVRADGTIELDIAIDRAWVTANGNYQLVEGMLRWVCPGCGKLSGAHVKGCDYR